MGTLFRFKQWVTVPEAAGFISGIVKDPVHQADVIRLAIDGHLTLSVNLVNGARARLGRVVPFSELRREDVPIPGREDEVMTIHNGHILDRNVNVIAEDTPFVRFDDEVTHIGGVWDLPMMASERIDAEHLFQQLTDGPEVTWVGLTGVFLRKEDGIWANLQDRFPDEVSESADGKKKTKKGGFYPASHLPDDAVFVVRTAAIEAFQALYESTLSGPKPVLADSVSTKERHSLLAIIGLLAEQAGFDIEKASKTASAIENAALLKGVQLSKRNIEGHLKKVDAAMAHLKR